MRVLVFANCWNEMRMLPWFMEHYKPFVHRFVILDDGSTDGSVEYLRNQANVTVIEENRKNESYLYQSRDFWNHGWKAVRDEADWIITCNVDEHAYHPDLRGYLSQCREDGVTLLPADGYEMISWRFPTTRGRLCDAVRIGSTPRHLIGNPKRLDKIMIFDPKAIEEINFNLGRNSAEPVGHLVLPKRQDLKLLHYKFIGLNYVFERYTELRSGLSLTDKNRGLGAQCLWDHRSIRMNHHLIVVMAQIIIPASRQRDLQLQAALLAWKLWALLLLTLDVMMEPRRLRNALRLVQAQRHG